MARRLLLAALLLLLAAPLRAQSFQNGFSFFMPPRDTVAAAFLPAFPAQALTEADRITAGPDAFLRGGVPYRFFGGNLTGDGAFPEKSQAAFVAGRYRNLGFNLVRFHHIDNPWGGYSLFPAAGGPTRTLRADMLDRLDNLIAHLKRNGVYVNMNLHVSRQFSRQDGVATADSILDLAKGVTLFDPQLVALQKEYARQLLGHVNPYTGLPLAHDPVLAMVEIVNENSLYFIWRTNNLKPQAEGGQLTAYHSRMLDDRWHDYLRARYASTDALRRAWGGPAADGPNAIAGAGFETGIPAAWALEQHETARATPAHDTANPHTGTAAARVTVTSGDGTDWHIQWKHTGLSVVEDTVYAVTFAARADAARSISAGVMLDVSPWTVFIAQSFDLTPAWQTFRFTFRAPQTAARNVRLTFQLGRQAGTFWFDDVTFTTTGAAGLAASESLEDGTVRRLDFSETGGASKARVRDLTAFYVQLQDDFYADMYAFLRDELGVRAPITGTNWNFGPVDLAVQAKLDYMDNHAYWDHPQFPGVPWSTTDWKINNTPMVRDAGGGAVAGLLAATTHTGRPATISEYNHAFPNRYQSEGPLFLTAYSAFHGVDGLMLFTYNGARRWETDKIEGYFDTHRNPAFMALVPGLALAYREGLIRTGEAIHTVRYSEDDVLEWPRRDDGSWPGVAPFPRTLALEHRIAVEAFDAAATTYPTAPAPQPPYATDTGEIVWDPTGGTLRVAAPRFAAATGFLDAATSLDLGAGTLVSGTGFATLTWVALDEQPLADSRRALLTLATTAQNTAMQWDGTTTVHDRWGVPPVVLRPQAVVLDLGLRADSVRLVPLAPSGDPAGNGTMLRPDAAGRFRVTLDGGADRTAWWGLEAFGLTGTAAEDPVAPAAFGMSAPWPNPAAGAATVRVTLPHPGPVEVAVYDVLGRAVQRTIRTAPAGPSDVRLDTSALGPGLYLVRLEGAGRTAARRLVVAQ